jgi:hypothetical protein
MIPQNRPLLSDQMPELVLELRKLLEGQGETALAAETPNLKIFERVDHRHGSDIYTAPRPSGSWGPRHRTLSLRPGALHVDVVGEEIVFVELLRRPTFSAQNTWYLRPNIS